MESFRIRGGLRLLVGVGGNLIHLSQVDLIGHSTMPTCIARSTWDKWIKYPETVKIVFSDK